MGGFTVIGLHQPKDLANIGGVFRAALAYEANLICVASERTRKDLTRIAADTPKAYRQIPVLRCANLQQMTPLSCEPVAVDLVEGASPLFEFKHPGRAFYIFGPEDGTLGADVLSWCTHRIFVPTKVCMNLASCVNVVLYDRMAKRA